MKKFILLGICLYCVPVIFAQEEQKQGDEMAADGNYSAAAMMYRLCMEQEEPCALKLFKLIYDEKIEPESTDELYQLISPLAEKGNAEAQFYLGELCRRGIGGVALDYQAAVKWFQKSADQGYENAQNELKALQTAQKEPIAPEVQPVTTPPEQPVTTPPAQTVYPAEKEVAAKTLSADNLQYKPSKSKLPVVLYAVGGIAIVAGTATYFLLPKTAEDVYANRDYSETTESNPYYKLPNERNPVYLIAGCAAGGVCIGTGIVLKSKDKKRQISDNYNLQSLPRQNEGMRLNLVATHNGAGLQLTF